MIKRLFGASTSITSAAIILALSGLLSRLLGVYRDRLLATTFGASSTLDAYYAAFRIPDFVFNIIVLGALSAGFIPVFTEYLSSSKERAWKLAQSALIIVSAAVSLLALTLFVTAPWLMKVITPGFPPETLALTVRMTRIMLLSPVFLGMSSLLGGVLQSFKRFFAYSLAPIFYNLGIILGVIYFVPQLGQLGLAWGVVFGSLLHLAMQAFVVGKLGWKWSLVWPWKAEGVKEILTLMIPRTMSLAINEGNLFVVTSLTSGLSSGSLAIFNFAHNLAHVPIGLIGISFGVAAFPILSSYAAKGKIEKFIKTQEKTVSAILFFLMPIIVVFVLQDEQIIRLILGAGKFDWQATQTTAHALLLMTPHMFCQTIVPLYTRSYYARKNSLYPFYAASIALVINGVSAYFLTGHYGVAGMAMALSLGSIIQLLMLMSGAEVRSRDMLTQTIRVTMLQTVVSAVCMGIVVEVLLLLLSPQLNLTRVPGVFLDLAIPSVAGYAIYLVVLRLMGSSEYSHYETVFKHKLNSLRHNVVPVIASGEEDDILKR